MNKDLYDVFCIYGVCHDTKKICPIHCPFLFVILFQVSVASAIQSLLCTPENSLCARSMTNDSLLDLVETQRAAWWKGVCICVVQRVYCLTQRHSPRHLHQERMKNILDTTAMPQKPNFRQVQQNSNYCKNYNFLVFPSVKLLSAWREKSS